MYNNHSITMKKTLLIGFALMASFWSGCAQNNAADLGQQNVKQQINQKEMKTNELTKAEFMTQVYNYEKNPNEWKFEGDKPAIIDFYATWCGPCRMVAPILDELAAEYADRIVIYKINTEKERDLAAAFGIRSIPSLLFIPVSGQPQMVQGALSKADFQNVIDEVLLKK